MIPSWVPRWHPVIWIVVIVLVIAIVHNPAAMGARAGDIIHKVIWGFGQLWVFVTSI